MIGYKLFRKRRDGTLGPLFIERKRRIEVGRWYVANDVPTKGYLHRPGWHVLLEPKAPHLSKRGRVWCEVQAEDIWGMYTRPASQGGKWLTAQLLCVLRELPKEGK